LQYIRTDPAVNSAEIAVKPYWNLSHFVMEIYPGYRHSKETMEGGLYFEI